MREILFRGKRLDNGEWVYGVGPLEVCPGKLATMYTPEELCYVKPETISQYTGLTDKNGKKIFEGDIIRTHYANVRKANFMEQVVFHSGRFCALYHLPEHGKMWAGLADGTPHLPQGKTAYMEWCEVIGNIYDNPELLEVGGGE